MSDSTAPRNEPGSLAQTNASQKSLRTLSIHGTLWTLGGHGTSELIRLGSNLLLTRLLIPDDFGLMVLVNVFLMGLQLFSDIGIGPSIIQSPRGEEKLFLDTAWTLQVVRGAGLWLLATALAYPYALFYDQPRLAALIAVAALSALISGFNSTNLFTLNRRLSLGKITILEVIQNLAGIGVMIIWAMRDPSVWALVAGGLVSAVVRAVLSHFLVPGIRPRFAWDREASRELYRFGRWIFLSTALGFFGSRGDRMVLGKVLSIADLGCYSIATVLSHNLVKLAGDVGRKVLFPVYARLRDRSQEVRRRQILQMRMAILAVALPPLWALTIWGPDIVELLWDPRYSDAGWMLQILSAGGVAAVLNHTVLPVLLASGDSFRHLLNTAARAALLAAAMLIGAWQWGEVGCLIGVAASALLQYPILAVTVRRYGAWMPGLDFAAIALSVAVVGTGLVFF